MHVATSISQNLKGSHFELWTGWFPKLLLVISGNSKREVK